MPQTLEAGHRTTYVDLFSPPYGERLVRAFGLSYSLDLNTLFAALLALAGVEGTPEEPGAENNANRKRITPVSPSETLHTLLELGDKVSVYCQAGKLKATGAPVKVHNLLDKIVHTVRPAAGSSFHPKLWILKFEKKDEAGVYTYRLIVSSRNFSNTKAYFEIAAALEGEPQPRAEGQNPELTSFLRHVCGDEKDIDGFCRELSHVKFTPPPDFTETRFFRQRGLPYNERLLANLKDCQFSELVVVSPFLSDHFLKTILDEGIKSRPTLVSTQEALDSTSAALLSEFDTFYVRDNPGRGNAEGDYDGNLSGLHAKLLVAERRGRTELWLGSANASSRGWFGANTECVLAMYSGKYSVKRFKEEFLRYKGKERPWIIPYYREKDEQDTEKRRKQKEMEGQLEKYIEFLARADWELSTNGKSAEITFKATDLALPDLDLITIEKTSVGLLGHSEQKSFPLALTWQFPVAIQDFGELTDFLSVEIRVKELSKTAKFLVQARSSFDKKDREDFVLRGLIQTEAEFWQCFRFLVDGDPVPSIPGDGGHGRGPGGAVITSYTTSGVLESLLKECARDPGRIVQIQRLMDLAAPEVKTEQLEEFWATFKAAADEVWGLKS